MITTTEYARHSRHFWPAELWTYATKSEVLGHGPTWDPIPRWRLQTVVEADVATALLVAAGAHSQGEPTREGGIIVRAGDPDSPTFVDCNSARMTVGDLGH